MGISNGRFGLFRFFSKNEVAFLAFLAFSLLKPMQNGFFLLGFLPKKPCSPYIKYSMAFSSRKKPGKKPFLSIILAFYLYISTGTYSTGTVLYPESGEARLP